MCWLTEKKDLAATRPLQLSERQRNLLKESLAGASDGFGFVEKGRACGRRIALDVFGMIWVV